MFFHSIQSNPHKMYNSKTYLKNLYCTDVAIEHISERHIENNNPEYKDRSKYTITGAEVIDLIVDIITEVRVKAEELVQNFYEGKYMVETFIEAAFENTNDKTGQREFCIVLRRRFNHTIGTDIFRKEEGTHMILFIRDGVLVTSYPVSWRRSYNCGLSREYKEYLEFMEMEEKERLYLEEEENRAVGEEEEEQEGLNLRTTLPI